jgi:hypothetical protein
MVTVDTSVATAVAVAVLVTTYGQQSALSPSQPTKGTHNAVAPSTRVYPGVAQYPTSKLPAPFQTGIGAWVEEDVVELGMTVLMETTLGDGTETVDDSEVFDSDVEGDFVTEDTCNMSKIKIQL